MNRNDIAELENILDRSNLCEVLDALVTICHEKADHLRSNWQDSVTAKLWEQDAATLDKAASKINA